MWSNLPSLLAQAAGGHPPPGGCGSANIVSLTPILLMFAVVYFLILRPQAKQAREHQQMLSALKKGDEVVTQGGIVGKVFAVSDTLVTVEVARDVRLRILKSNIASLYTPPSQDDGDA